MKPMQTNHQFLAWVSGHPLDETASNWEKVTTVIMSLLGFSLSLVFTFGSLYFFMIFVKVDFGNVLYGLFQFCSGAPTTISCIIVILLQKKIFALIDDLNKIYDACGN